MTRRMISNTRQERLDGILDCLIEDDTASAQTLAARFEVSLMTIHRDLDELQRRGVVRKFRGGVSIERTRSYEIAAALRRRIAVPQKLALAAAAAESVLPGQVVMLDDSTTVAQMISHLAGIEELRVVTNFLPAMGQLAAEGSIAITAIGGDYDHGHESFLGEGAVRAVRALRVDTLFFSTSSADAHGIYHQEEKIVSIKSAMTSCARRRVMLMDSSKLEQTSLHRISGWDSVDELITDAAAPEHFVETVRELGVQVRMVAVAEHDEDEFTNDERNT